MGEALRIGVVAGEASGDLLGAQLLTALRQRYGEVRVEGVGGPLLAAQGLASLAPMERLSVMGLVEPLARLPELLRLRRRLYRHFRRAPPHLFLGIDSPDFNLPLARRLRARGIATAQLVSPSVWAWRRGRLRGIGRAVDRVLCLFPFEPPVYRQRGIAAEFVGHPLADAIPFTCDRAGARARLGLAHPGRMLALLPGSRGGEIRALGPLFLEVAERLWRDDPQLAFVLPVANPACGGQLAPLLARFPQLPVTVLQGRAREAMAAADAVLLASGTATLEAALLRRPMVVAWRTGRVTWWVLSRLVHSEFAALPNVLAGRPLVPELLQDAATPEALLAALRPLLYGAPPAQLEREFEALHRQLRRGFATRCAAALAPLLAPGRG